VSLRFNIFGLSWNCMDLTCVTIRITHGSLYMTWPNEKLTHGSTNENRVVQMLMWQGDYVVQK
jgi:hypothetical protein